MNTVKLVTSPKHNIMGAHGCCGIGTIARLSAVEIKHSNREAAISRYLKTDGCSGYPYTRKDMKPKTMLSLIGILEKFPRNDLRANGTTSWHGGAVSVDIAFAALLDYLQRNMKFVCYFLSDNIEEVGDVHMGPYNTRAFHKWFLTNDLGSSVSSGPMESLRTHRMLQAWIITPHWDIVSKYIKPQRERLIQQIEEINNHECIKQQRQDVIAERARESNELQQSLASW